VGETQNDQHQPIEISRVRPEQQAKNRQEQADRQRHRASV